MAASTGEDTWTAERIATTLNLVNVLVESFSAQAFRVVDVVSIHLELGTGWSNADDGHLWIRHTVTCKLFSIEVTTPEEMTDDVLVAQLECRLVFDYAGAEELPEIDVDVMREFSATYAVKEAFPYIREAISSMTTRLGLARVTLGTADQFISGNTRT